MPLRADHLHRTPAPSGPGCTALRNVLLVFLEIFLEVTEVGPDLTRVLLDISF